MMVSILVIIIPILGFSAVDDNIGLIYISWILSVAFPIISISISNMSDDDGNTYHL